MSKRKRQFQLPQDAGQLPQHQRPQATFIAQQQIRIAPLPKPEELAAYNDALPGLAERIVTMAEENGRDRRKNNRTMRWVSILGQLFVFILMMTGLLGGFYMVNEGKDVAGVAAIVTAIATPLGVFVYSRTRKS